MKIAILNVGHFHSPIYVGGCLKLGHEVVLHEEDEAIAKVKSEKHQLPVGQRVENFLDREKPDFAVCMGPNDAMAAVIGACVNRGIPLLAEKPGARAAAELLPVVERAEKAGLFTAAAFSMRWHPAWTRATELLPRLGILGRIHLDYFAGPVARYAEMFSPWMANKERTGGGCFLNLGVHAYDMLRYWGFDDCSFQGRYLSHAWKQAAYEDLGLAVLQRGDTLIEIETGYCAVSPKTAFQGEIFGETGNLFVSESRLRFTPVDGKVEETDYAKHEDAVQGGRQAMLRDIFRCLESGERPRATLSDLLESLHFTDWCYADRLSAT